MFEMKIERQINLKDRTLILGIPTFDALPKRIQIGDSDYKVLGISVGGKPPYMSFEIEKATESLNGEKALA